MKSPRHIRPPEMARPAIPWLMLLLLGFVLLGITGCETNEPENESVRPWNAPQSWEGNSPMLNQQRQ
jgi:hypothetical protein